MIFIIDRIFFGVYCEWVVEVFVKYGGLFVVVDLVFLVLEVVGDILDMVVVLVFFDVDVVKVWIEDLVLVEIYVFCNGGGKLIIIVLLG